MQLLQFVRDALDHLLPHTGMNFHCRNSMYLHHHVMNNIHFADLVLMYQMIHSKLYVAYQLRNYLHHFRKYYYRCSVAPYNLNLFLTYQYFDYFVVNVDCDFLMNDPNILRNMCIVYYFDCNLLYRSADTIQDLVMVAAVILMRHSYCIVCEKKKKKPDIKCERRFSLE